MNQKLIKFIYMLRILMKENTNFQLRQEKLDAQSTLIIQKLEYSNDMDVICKNTEDCNPNKKRKILIIF